MKRRGDGGPAAWIKPFVEIRNGERTKTFFMFLYFFLTIALVYVLKPVQKSLFLAEFGAKNLRYAYMGEGLFLVAVVGVYVQAAKRIPRRFFYPGVLGFFLANLIVFWLLLRLHLPYLSAAFYLWQASFSITLTTIFWSMANDIFNAFEAKRLFGLIISGGSAGGIAGSFLTGWAVRWIRTEDVLLLAAGLLVFCIASMVFFWDRIHQGMTAKTQVSSEETETGNAGRQKAAGKTRSGFKIFRKSSYLIMLAALVIIAKMTSTVVDNQFSSVVEASFSGHAEPDSMTAFFGFFQAVSNVVSFVMQLFVTGICLRSFGVGGSLWILPAGLFLLSFGSVFWPALFMGMLFRLYDGSMNYSLQQAGKEVFYLPLSSSLRRRVKPVIDMLGFRAGKTLGGVYIALMTPLLGIPVEKLGILVMILIPVWFLIAWRMQRAYSKLLYEHLLKKSTFRKSQSSRSASEVVNYLNDEKSFEGISLFLNHRSTYARKMAATAYWVYRRSEKRLEPVKRLMKKIALQEAFHKFEKAAPDRLIHELQEQDIRFLEDLKLLNNGEKDWAREEFDIYLKKHADSLLVKLAGLLRENTGRLDVKRRTVRILEGIPQQKVADLLLHTVAAIQDHSFRFVIIRALNRLQGKNPKIAVNRLLVKSEIEREILIHEKAQKLRGFYLRRTGDPGPDGDGDYPGIALKAIQEESLERIFQYLKLLYAPAMIDVIQEKIRAHVPSEAEYVHAAELLVSIVDGDLRRMLQGTLDGGPDAAPQDREIAEILKEFGKAEDRWLSLIGRLLIREKNLGDHGAHLAQMDEELSREFFQEAV